MPLPRPWLLLLYFSLIASLLSSLGLKSITKTQDLADPHEAQRPNLLVIVADDLGYNDISTINPTGLSTPNIDDLANQGVVFTRHYADSICAPSRVGLLTGRFPERSGFRPSGLGIPEEFLTLPERLSGEGYRTKLVGKWHAGTAHRRSWPDHHGFEEWFGFLDQWRLQVPAAEFGTLAAPSYSNPWLQKNGHLPERHEGHLTDILTEHSRQFIRDAGASERPWFLYHAFLAPHNPIEPAPRFAQQFEDSKAGKYKALVAQMDHSIGQILQTLRETGEDANTIVVFLSDNGGTNAALDNNFPFRGKKGEVFEGSFRTPLIISWPAALSSGRIERPVHNIDIYPSLMGALGLSVDETLDGRNRWPQWLSSLRGVNPAPGSDYIRVSEKFHEKHGTLSFSILSLDGRWRLSSLFGLPPMLFDLQSDPTGFEDVAQDHPDVVASLMDSYRQMSRQNAELAIEQQEAASGSRELLGFDQMRVPDEYGRTVLFELRASGQADAPLLIAEDGVWRLSIGSDHRLQVQSEAGVLASTAALTGECAVVGLTFDYQRSHFIGGQQPPETTVSLYLNGILQDQRAVGNEVTRRKEWPATRILSDSIGQVRYYNLRAFGAADSLPYAARSDTELIDTARRQGNLIFPALLEMSQGLCPSGIR